MLTAKTKRKLYGDQLVVSRVFRRIENIEDAHYCIKIGIIGFYIYILAKFIGSVQLATSRIEAGHSVTSSLLMSQIIVDGLIIIGFLLLVYATKKKGLLPSILFCCLGFSPLFVDYWVHEDNIRNYISTLSIFIIAFICLQTVRGNLYIRKINKNLVQGPPRST